MKKFLLFISLLLILSSESVKAQTWGSPGATWYYSLDLEDFLFYRVGTNTVQYFDTATVNGIVCKRYALSFYGKTILGGAITTMTLDMGRYDLYENNNVLFVHNFSGGFDTVLNYSALPGDKWLQPLYQSNCILARGKITVIDTGHVTINGQYLKAFDFGNGLFPLKMYFAFPQVCVIDQIGYGSFSCYKDDNFQIYSLSGNHACNLTSVKNESLNKTAIPLYPNPNNGNFTIELTEASSVKVYNTLGALVKEISFNSEGVYTIELTTLPKGIYYIKTVSKFAEINTKLIKD